MTNEQINVAIHLAKGLDVLSEGWIPSYQNPDNRNFDKVAEPLPIPDYCNDLNAMHEAENWLEYGCKQWFAEEGNDSCVGDAYVWNLHEVCNSDMFSLVGASAPQRAEAFLRTLGKWVDA